MVASSSDRGELRQGTLYTIALTATLLAVALPLSHSAIGQEGPAADDRPSYLDIPTVEGVMREGEVILALPGMWFGKAPIAYRNRWERCDVSRCLATGEVHFLKLLRRADVGRRLRTRVTASNDVGSALAFSAQTAIVRPLFELLRPFPVIGIGGVITGEGVRLRRLTVRAPPDSTVRVSCRGRGCPYRTAVRHLTRSSMTVRAMAGRSLRAGTVIELRVTAPGRIGKYTRFRIRARRRPARVDRCLVPQQPRPSRCSPQGQPIDT